MTATQTQAIVLARTDFGEADRILTFITPDQGKVKAIAKGVRKTKSKLAGGIELFSVSDISFIPGRKEISTVVSTRLKKHYGQIVKDLDRTAVGFELIKRINKATEDSPEPAYFYLLQEAFEALDDSSVDFNLIKLWFDMQLLRLGGHSPNLYSDDKGHKLLPDSTYTFDFDNVRFVKNSRGKFTSGHIKFLRIGFSASVPRILNRINNANELAAATGPLIQSLLQSYIRL
ncbi:MAG TPA: DNA repair protein RecO [Candidatus Saccharimonadales bacterium]|nr:DNA repair protein RecO [Candidatus Saccharimonadales bacterium]